MEAAAASLTQLPAGRLAAVAALAAGAPLAAFSARAVDAWGNAAAPSDALPCELVLECAALEPPSVAAPFSAAGVACMQGALLVDLLSHRHSRSWCLCVPR